VNLINFNLALRISRWLAGGELIGQHTVSCVVNRITPKNSQWFCVNNALRGERLIGHD